MEAVAEWVRAARQSAQPELLERGWAASPGVKVAVGLVLRAAAVVGSALEPGAWEEQARAVSTPEAKRDEYRPEEEQPELEQISAQSSLQLRESAALISPEAAPVLAARGS